MATIHCYLAYSDLIGHGMVSEDVAVDDFGFGDFCQVGHSFG